MSSRSARKAATSEALRLCRPDAQRQRPQAPQRQEAVERSGYRPTGVLEEPQSLGHARVPRHRDADDRVAVARQVLRRRVEDDVGAQVQRPLEDRGRKGVVDDDEGPWAVPEPLPQDRGRAGDVDHLEERVGRRLEPDQPGRVGQRLPHRLWVRRQVGVARHHAAGPRGPSRGSGTCRRRRRRRRRSRSRHRPAPRSPPSPPSRRRRRPRSRRPPAPPRRARTGPGSGSWSWRSRSRRSAARRRPGW